MLALSDARLAETLKTNAVPIKRDTSTIQLDVGYRGSTLARDDRDEVSTLHAGDRAPDATGLTTIDGPRRLFELIGGGHFTLLTFGVETADTPSTPETRVLRVVDAVGDEEQIGDPHGQLAATYLASDRALILIRPDGYIGLISDAGDARSVSEYFDAIGYAHSA